MIVLMPTWLAAAAASGASAASSAGRFHFDPAVMLPWAVPLLLIVPVAGLVMLLVGVRTRRGAAGLAATTGVVTLLDALVVAWPRFGQTGVYRVAYPWISVSVSFGGDSRFQSFEIDIGFRVTQVVLALLIGLLVVFTACIAWHRLAGRQEQGPVRSQAAALLLLLGAIGVLVSGDLAALLAFWGVAGVASYLLLSNRWGTEAGGRAGVVALVVPYIGDLALLGAVGLLWSRFGATDIDKLAPMLGNTLGVGQKSTGAIAALIVVAVAARSAIWPFTPWQTATAGAPAALAALVAAVWPVLAGHLLYLSLPMLGAAGPQPVRYGAWVMGAAAVIGPLLSVVGVELRRSLILASSGAVALCLLAILYPGAAAAGLTGLLAVAAARAGGLLAAGWIVATMRTADLRLVGEGLRRMPLATAGLAGSALATTAAGVAASAWRHQSWPWIALAIGLGLAALAAWRVWAAVALPPLPRRRAFEPTRIRDTGRGVAATIFACGLVGVAAGILSFIAAWTAFAVPSRPAPPTWQVELLWLLPALAGLAIGGGTMAMDKTVTLALTGRAADAYRRGWTLAYTLWERSIAPALLAAIGAVELRALPGLETGVGRGLTTVGVLLSRGLPYLPAVAGLAVIVGGVLGLVGSGGRR
jgi:NADH:ubiquinone oxidoreductase subunit 5 (subunit L)/multisubunit Na+/H+ antiporter MnhA subunit